MARPRPRGCWAGDLPALLLLLLLRPPETPGREQRARSARRREGSAGPEGDGGPGRAPRSRGKGAYVRARGTRAGRGGGEAERRPLRPVPTDARLAWWPEGGSGVARLSLRCLRDFRGEGGNRGLAPRAPRVASGQRGSPEPPAGSCADAAPRVVLERGPGQPHASTRKHRTRVGSAGSRAAPRPRGRKRAGQVAHLGHLETTPRRRGWRGSLKGARPAEGQQ